MSSIFTTDTAARVCVVCGRPSSIQRSNKQQQPYKKPCSENNCCDSTYCNSDDDVNEKSGLLQGDQLLISKKDGNSYYGTYVVHQKFP